MPDYGHDLLFGIFPTPAADQRDQLVALARRADELGLDLIGVQDHPYQPRFLETWTLLSAMAAETETSACSPTSRTCRCARRPSSRGRPRRSTC